MQSSTAIAFRALIMLVFLISVPLLAIFGKDLPDVIKKLMEGRLSVQLTEQPNPVDGPVVSSPPSTGISGPPAPPNNPFAEPASYRVAPATAQQSAPAATHSIAPSNLGPPPAGFPNAVGPPSAAAPVTVAPTGSFSPPPPSNWPNPPPTITNASGNVPVSMQSKSPPDAFLPPTDVRPIGVPEAVRQNSPDSPAEGLSTGSVRPAGANDDKFRQAETRLRELGATQYVLETWGPQNDRYRFACRMAIGGNIAVTQHFEAVEGDPLQAMENVLNQVDEWQKKAIQ